VTCVGAHAAQLRST